MPNGWPVFDAWAARNAELKALPQYGGNNIPDSYLNRFNARVAAQLERVGARGVEAPGGVDTSAMPVQLQSFLEGI